MQNAQKAPETPHFSGLFRSALPAGVICAEGSNPCAFPCLILDPLQVGPFLRVFGKLPMLQMPAVSGQCLPFFCLRFTRPAPEKPAQGDNGAVARRDWGMLFFGGTSGTDPRFLRQGKGFEAFHFFACWWPQVEHKWNRARPVPPATHRCTTCGTAAFTKVEQENLRRGKGFQTAVPPGTHFVQDRALV